MTEESNETPESPSQEENQEETETPETEETTEESSEAEKPENQKEIETLQAQKEHWRTKAEKAEKELLRIKPKVTQEDSDSEFKPRVEFLLENRDLSAEEYAHLAAVAVRNSGKITLDSLRDARKTETEYISYLRKKVENKRKSPGSTSPGGAPSFMKSPGEIQKMTPEEHRAYDERLMKEQSNTGI